jgi:5'-3' exonuclease
MIDSSDLSFLIDYLYMDFNPIIYISLLEIQKVFVFKNAEELEAKLLEAIIFSTEFIVNELVRPKKLLHIAIDGPAPKCKLVTQRARRYKGIYEKQVKAALRKKYAAEGTTSKKVSFEWDKANITPGTPFMEKLDHALKKAIDNDRFKCPKIVLNNSSIASEGEHKITRHLSTLNHHPDEKICVYSNDGDMAFLALQFPEKNIYTMIDANFLPKTILKKCTCPYVYFDNKAFHRVFVKDLMYEPKYNNSNKRPRDVEEQSNDVNEKMEEIYEEPEVKLIEKEENVKKEVEEKDEIEVEEKDEEVKCPWNVNRILMDFLCVSFLGGNDFVRPLPFGEIRKSGSYLMYLRAYKRAKKRNERDYLITIKHNSKTGQKNVIINKKFFGDIIFGLSRQESKKIKDYQTYIKQECNKEPNWGPFPEWSEEWLQYQHTLYSESGHPEHPLVRDELISFGNFEFDITKVGKTNFTKENDTKAKEYSIEEKRKWENDMKESWKAAYYKRNFGLDASDTRSYNFERTKICRAYIKGIIFTMNYYVNGFPPSWRWTYPYHVSPWPSDIMICLRNTDFKLLSNFNIGNPYTSLEQLLLTVPMSSVAFPKEYIRKDISDLLPDIKSPMKIDRLNGDKYIYCEPILKDIDEGKILQLAKKIPLSEASKKRNLLRRTEYIKTQ